MAWHVRSFVAFISVRRHRRQQWKRRERRHLTSDATFLLGCSIDRLVPISWKSQKQITSNRVFWDRLNLSPKTHGPEHPFSFDIRGHPYMTSSLRGGGGVSPKEDVVREVA